MDPLAMENISEKVKKNGTTYKITTAQLRNPNALLIAL